MEIAKLVNSFRRSVGPVNLTEEQVDRILQDEELEVYHEIKTQKYEDIEEGDSYWADVASRLGISEERVREWFHTEGFPPNVTINPDQWAESLKNYNGLYNAVLPDCMFNLANWSIGLPVNYYYIKETIKLLGINPMEFRKHFSKRQFMGHFPDIPREPVVDIEDIYNANFTNGVVCLCLENLNEIAEALSCHEMIFKAGTILTIYDYNTGKLSVKTRLRDDITVRKKAVRFVRELKGLSDFVSVQEWSIGEVSCVASAKLADRLNFWSGYEVGKDS